MSPIVVIGAGGYVGRRVVAALKAFGNREVVPASRRPTGGELLVDLERSSSLSHLDGYPIIVNCGPSTTPELADYAIRRGATLLDCTADRQSIEEVRERVGGEAAPGGPGLAVLGVGLFPGLSNLLGRQALDAVPGAGRVAIGIRTELLSGAGSATSNLMVKLLTRDAVVFRDGRPVSVAPFGRARPFTFPSGRNQALLVDLPEALMLGWSTGCPNAEAYVAFSPSVAVPAIVLASRTLRGLPGPQSRALVGTMVRALRTHLLAGRTAGIELVAVAEGPNAAATRWLAVNDGMTATALAIAAATRLLPEPGYGPSGVRLPDEVLDLAGVIQEMKAYAPRSFRLQLGRSG